MYRHPEIYATESATSAATGTSASDLTSRSEIRRVEIGSSERVAISADRRPLTGETTQK